MRSLANKGYVQELSILIRDCVPKLSVRYDQPTPSGKKDYTYAVGRFWNKYREDQEKLTGNKWDLYPDRTKSRRTRGGEYLVDFILFEDGYGPRIACESEWSALPGGVEWDFDKLCGVKSDIKVLLYESAHAELLEKLKKNCLAGNALITTDEAFLLVRLNGKNTEARWWKPDGKGPFEAKDINFEKLTS